MSEERIELIEEHPGWSWVLLHDGHSMCESSGWHWTKADAIQNLERSLNGTYKAFDAWSEFSRSTIPADKPIDVGGDR